MAMLHIVDPGSEVEADKLHKINPLIDFFEKYMSGILPA